MGNNVSSQFLRALRDEDVMKATELYHTKAQLRASLQPNLSLGSEHHDNTYLHYAAHLGLSEMYGDLIHEHGKPDMKNAQRRNCLHLICCKSSAGDTTSGCDDITKCNMLQLTLRDGLAGMDLKHLLAEKDENGNTALHLAAGAGLKDCVELFLSYDADMVATNMEGQTPADLAKAKDHGYIATSLEAKMVFSRDEDLAESIEPDAELLEEIAEAPVIMQNQDLRSMKDALLIETSEILGVSLQSAEVLLKHYGWSKEELLQAWVNDSEAVCASTGVDLLAATQGQDMETTPLEVGVAVSAEVTVECGICCVVCENDVKVPCGHHFCKDCWIGYLEQKILKGDSQNITCPQYACYKLVPLEIIEGLVSQDVAAKFLSFDIQAFVDSNPNIRWCPHPGCSQAISLPEDSAPSHSSGEVKGQTVSCGYGHYFCWDCLEEAHEPCSCTQWKRWLEHCGEMKARIGTTTAAEANEAATSKWLVDYSKPCPKCKAPIEKTEGCNHMCCKYCRHDFCWVCLEDWKCHNSSTGGYFNCNRYDAQRKAGQFLNQRKQEVLRSCKDWDQMSKFLHYHERYMEHINSYQLEEPFLDKAQQKMIELAMSIQHLESSNSAGRHNSELSPGRHNSEVLSGRHNSEALSGRVHQASFTLGIRNLDLSFIQDAVQELLRCRQVLKATYCCGYYLTGIVSKRQFEHMQGALEQVTEMLAEAVARPHLRKPRLEIIRLTREARVKRVWLIKSVHSGLPLSTHPFMDTFGGSGLPWETSTRTHPDSTLKRFLHDLDSYTPPQARTTPPVPGNRYKPDSDEDLLRVLEASRREYQADRQMQADLELAKTLSMPPLATLEELVQGHHQGWPLVEESSRANGVQSPPPQTRSQDWGSDEPPCNVDDWEPLYNEDLKIAIQDSLKDATASSGCVTADMADPIENHSRRGMLVTGHEGSKPFGPPNHQLVGKSVLEERRQRTDGSSSMLQFSSTQLHTEIPKTSPSPGHLPSQLQQLLDSSERLGTNV